MQTAKSGKKRWIFMGGDKSKVTSDQLVSRNASSLAPKLMRILQSRAEQSNTHERIRPAIFCLAIYKNRVSSMSAGHPHHKCLKKNVARNRSVK